MVGRKEAKMGMAKQKNANQVLQKSQGQAPKVLYPKFLLWISFEKICYIKKRNAVPSVSLFRFRIFFSSADGIDEFVLSL